MFDFYGVDLNKYPNTKKYNLSNALDVRSLSEEIRYSILQKHLDNGVVFRTFDGVYIDDTVVIGKGTQIFADNQLRGNTVIAEDCIIQSGNVIADASIGTLAKVLKSVIKDSSVGSKTTVGPYANIHKGSKVGIECRVGNFVEIKNARIGMKTKMAHLAYIGDVDIGNLCNIGCGSIFVNYDGKNKHRSQVGDSVFIGSNSNIIAPIIIEDNAYIAAGTTVTVDLPKNCMCIGRNRETIKENRTKYLKNNSMKKYFGTDGIRGVYGETITEDIAYMTGNIIGYSANMGTVVVGRDSRISGKELSKALIRGILDAGSNVIDLGIISTPCVAFVTTHSKSNYGVVLSASHNPAQYNGIKIFNYDGRKLTDIEEVEIENHIDSKTPIFLERRGEVLESKQYIDSYFKDLVRRIGDLSGFSVVLDCANGAASSYAKDIFERLGCKVFAYNTSEDGNLINKDCGALHPEFCSQKVLEHKANFGFCFDGDADRVIGINSDGKVINGDGIIYIMAKHLLHNNALDNNGVVGTFYSNLGVEKSLNKLGIALFRSDVGDHNVMEAMFRNRYVLGGEQAGHIILRDFANTGDGLFIALYLCKIEKDLNRSLTELEDCEHYPQVLLAVITKEKDRIINDGEVLKQVQAIEEELADLGRILFRASGTEPKVRIMVEAKDLDVANKVAQRIKNIVEKRLAEYRQ